MSPRRPAVRELRAVGVDPGIDGVLPVRGVLVPIAAGKGTFKLIAAFVPLRHELA
jgi:hypothetical protein